MSQDTPAGPPGAPPSAGQYEFTGEQNLRIERAGTSSAVWAVCAMLGALLLGTLAALQIYLHNVRGAVLVAPLFLICAVAGWLYLGTGKALKEVVTTQGNDVDLLMRALERLTRAFRYEVIATAVALVLFAVLAAFSRM
jgi:ABC-type spermidine/putrescine transport system permease subunit II